MKTRGVEVLIHYPPFGSLWLSNAEWQGEYVVGDAWDDSGAGSGYMPDDYHGEWALMNFPISCVDKVRADYERLPSKGHI